MMVETLIVIASVASLLHSKDCRGVFVRQVIVALPHIKELLVTTLKGKLQQNNSNTKAD